MPLLPGRDWTLPRNFRGMNCAACHGYRSFDSSPLSLLPVDFQPVSPRFQTLLTKSPPLPVSPGAILDWFSGSHVIRRGRCLACWLGFADIRCGLRIHPPCAGHGQAFGFPGFQDGYPTPANRHHHWLAVPDGTVHASHSETGLSRPAYPVKLSAGLAACATRARVRQFSLAPLPCFHGLSSLRLVTGSTLSGNPRAGLFTSSPIDRHVAAFPPRSCVRVAQSLAWNGVEGGSCTRQRPVVCRASTTKCTRLPLSGIAWLAMLWTLPGPAVAQLAGWQPALCPRRWQAAPRGAKAPELQNIATGSRSKGILLCSRSPARSLYV